MPDFSLAATACPAIQTASDLLRPGTDPPVRASVVIPGALGPGSTSTPVNTNAVHAENLARAGGVWAYAAIYGLDLSSGGGLTLNISAGGAGVGAVPTVAVAQSLALTNNADNYIWIQQDGTPALRLNVITPPATAAAYLGMVPVVAGVQGTPDYSGRVENRGGSLYRRTGDAGAPGDTPPAEVMILTETDGGLYLWTGDAYWKLVTGGASVYTQTYATADRTLGAYTPDTESVAYTGAADSEAKLADLNALRVAYENLRASHDDLMQFVTAVVDDLQARGIVA